MLLAFQDTPPHNQAIGKGKKDLGGQLLVTTTLDCNWVRLFCIANILNIALVPGASSDFLGLGETFLPVRFLHRVGRILGGSLGPL